MIYGLVNLLWMYTVFVQVRLWMDCVPLWKRHSCLWGSNLHLRKKLFHIYKVHFPILNGKKLSWSWGWLSLVSHSMSWPFNGTVSQMFYFIDHENGWRRMIEEIQSDSRNEWIEHPHDRAGHGIGESCIWKWTKKKAKL